MKNIALRYSSEKLTSLVFDGQAQNQELFETIKLTDLLINTKEETGILLNGRKYNHILYKHFEFEVVISANEIDTYILTFLQNFWMAKFKYIAFYVIGFPNDSWSNYIQVMTDGGKFPINYINDIKDLREINFNLSFVEPI